MNKSDETRAITCLLSPGLCTAGTATGFLCNVDDLVSLKLYLHAPFTSLYDDIHACAGLDSKQVAAFDWEMKAFHEWYNAPLPYCRATAELQTGRDFLKKLNDYREVLAKASCEPSAPAVAPLAPDDPRNDPKGIITKIVNGEIETPLDKLNSILKTAAIVGGIGLAAYGLYLTAPLVRGWAASRSTK
jgi:hypothetical protein